MPLVYREESLAQRAGGWHLEGHKAGIIMHNKCMLLSLICLTLHTHTSTAHLIRSKFKPICLLPSLPAGQHMPQVGQHPLCSVPQCSLQRAAVLFAACRSALCSVPQCSLSPATIAARGGLFIHIYAFGAARQAAKAALGSCLADPSPGTGSK